MESAYTENCRKIHYSWATEENILQKYFVFSAKFQIHERKRLNEISSSIAKKNSTSEQAKNPQNKWNPHIGGNYTLTVLILILWLCVWNKFCYHLHIKKINYFHLTFLLFCNIIILHILNEIVYILRNISFYSPFFFPPFLVSFLRDPPWCYCWRKIGSFPFNCFPLSES